MEPTRHRKGTERWKSHIDNCSFVKGEFLFPTWWTSDVWFTAQFKLDEKKHWSLSVHYHGASWGKPDVFNTPFSCLGFKLRCPWRSFMIETWKLLHFWHFSLPESSYKWNAVVLQLGTAVRFGVGLLSPLNYEWRWVTLTVWMVDVCEWIKLKVLLDSDVLFAGSPLRLSGWLKNCLCLRGMFGQLESRTTRENDGDVGFEDDWSRAMKRLLSGCWLCLGFSSCATSPINSTTVRCTCQSEMCLE